MLLQALILAIGSSIDNFAVGLSLGLTGLPCKLHINTIIAFSNALGACIASAGGLFITNTTASGSIGSLLAAIVFAHLSKEEFCSFRRKEPTSPLVQLASKSEGSAAIILNLAIPMTLNNLAGGVAGGVVGITPMEAFGCAFLVSFVFMMGGHVLGGQIRSFNGRNSGKNGEGEEEEKDCRASSYLDPRIGAAFIFGGLSLMQLFEIFAV
uniref:GDT1 family protein n=1 Tax=Helicotheca tamesis TaxID=374047 RepID=A0A7S2MGE7_9STRA|mmetsp:Transcript_15692/g.21514  ORF Transcript_15692/g.21514 Transcript_15692/m.21514 type:complete len:210 (+) Transcript_15692:130-759(+)|eukprot:CAMPEP_0185727924 /NCGR_PEP_ID=MMETSP1171-20130828/3460_1 /TAXON_ID=374046 /ORGANISM="Helicotheca tamensis, Strain CCMP826" /LENGTH=209 /DNA_ID=CAMNT_0028396569 /DNA_START=77 /DNA_END=706 /DNA_ORIENTATION=-